LALMAATARLGVWQMDRAAQKTALHEQVLKQKAALVSDFSQFVASKSIATSKSWDSDFHRPAVAVGQWLTQHTVLLDNRQMDGRPGFFVLTPLLIDGAQDADGKSLAIMVQRGWLPRDFLQRERVADVPTPAGRQRVPVRVASPPARLLELGGNAAKDTPLQASASRIRQNLELAQFAKTMSVGTPQARLIEAAMLLQTADAELQQADGLKRDWPQADSGVAKHHGYAFQWFGLCALTALLLLWFQIIAPLRSKRVS
jgi:surfeit locus 1 family protein